MIRAGQRDSESWDAESYDQLSDPQYSWGQRVLDRLRLQGDETVLDAGCGTGRLTALLLERLPKGRVIAVDRSEAMLAEARSNLAVSGKRVLYVCTDLMTMGVGRPRRCRLQHGHLPLDPRPSPAVPRDRGGARSRGDA